MSLAGVVMLLAFAPLPAASAVTARRVVLVSVDGLDGGRAADAAELPALRSIAANGVATRVIGATPYAWPALVELLSGAPATASRASGAAGPAVDPEARPIAVALTRAGFRCAAFPADPLAHAGSGLATGFAHYSTRAAGIPDSARVDSALAWLAGGGRRFAWLGLTLGAPESPWRRMDGTGPRDPSALASRVAAVDVALARLHRGIERMLPGPPPVMIVVGTGWSAARLALASDEELAAGRFAVPLIVSIPLELEPRAPLAGWAEVTRSVCRIAGVAEGSAPATSASDDFAAELARAMGAGATPADAPRRWRAMLDALDALEAAPDSLGLARLDTLAARAPASPRLAIEDAMAHSHAGREFVPSRELKRLTQLEPLDPEAVVAYADHLRRFRHPDIMHATLVRVPPEAPLGALVAWRDVLPIAAEGHFGEAAVAAEAASRLVVPGPAALTAPDTLRRLATEAEAVHADPRGLEPRFAFAGTLAGFGLLDEAYEQLNTARALAPGSGEPDYRLGVLLAEAGRTANAIAVFRRALMLDPRHRGAHLALADALLESGRRDEARQQLELGLADDPGAPRAQFNLACLLAAAGESARALDALERAVDQGYDDWDRLRNDADLSSLRAEPRYRRLLARVAR